MEGLLLLIVVGLCIYYLTKDPNKPTEEEIQARKQMERNMICPHCHTRGTVTTMKARVKDGIHGGKATAAVLTCGITLLGTGLSRKKWITKASCNNCGQTWTY